MAGNQKKTGRKTVSKARKRKTVRKVPVRGIVYSFLLAAFFFFSIGVLTYVIFFRMVVAAELPEANHQLMFEEPYYPTSAISGDGRTQQTDEPQFSILIDDMGYHLEVGKKLLALDLDLSFSFLPHAPHTPELEKMAYTMGKTILLHLPMQPKDQNWHPGPGALYLNEMDEQENVIGNNLAAVPYAVGVNNHMGSLYTENQEAMQSLMDIIADKKLFFIDSFTSSESLGYEFAKSKGIKTARRDIFLDNVLDSSVICSQLDELILLAQGRGKAIGIAHPHKETLVALERCVADVALPVKLVPVTALIR